MVVAVTVHGARPLGAFQVQLRIEFQKPQEDQEALYQEKLYLLRPTWSESDERSNLLQEKKDALANSRDFDRF